MDRITDIRAREILDSRGHPSIEAEIYSHQGLLGRASVPSGASRGSREAVELRDHDARYFGRGCRRVKHHIETEIKTALQGMSVYQQSDIDAKLIALDGTSQKQRLGANALLAVSQACVLSAAKLKNQPVFHYLNPEACILPRPMFNLINGGAHADNRLDIQEFMVIPSFANSFSEALQAGAEIFQALKSWLKKQAFSTAVGDEGGFAPDLPSHRAALDCLMQAIEQAGFKAGSDIHLALDVASTEFYLEGVYHLQSEARQLNSTEFVEYLSQLVRQYPIQSIEDGMSEDDWPGWKTLSERLSHIQLVGDDVFVTNSYLLKRGIQEGLANAILIKANQIGTITETLQAIRCAQASDYQAILSHRSGETEDTSIADFAVAWQVGQIKAGSLCRGERIAKYNQLLRIEDALGRRAALAPKLATLALQN